MARTIREVINEIEATPDNATTFRLLAELHLMLSYRWKAFSLEGAPSQEYTKRKITLLMDIDRGAAEVMRRRRNSILDGSLDDSDIYYWRKLNSNEESVLKFIDELLK